MPRRRVLVVDDDENIVQLVKMYLEWMRESLMLGEAARPPGS